MTDNAIGTLMTRSSQILTLVALTVIAFALPAMVAAQTDETYFSTSSVNSKHG